jgi:hypothetical protein
MLNSQQSNDQFQELYTALKKYLALNIEYAKVEFVEKLTILLSTLLLGLLILLLAAGALFYLFFALAYTLESLLGSMALSYTVISSFYLILIALLAAFRKQLIINPLVKFLSNLFLNKSEN